MLKSTGRSKGELTEHTFPGRRDRWGTWQSYPDHPRQALVQIVMRQFSETYASVAFLLALQESMHGLRKY